MEPKVERAQSLGSQAHPRKADDAGRADSRSKRRGEALHRYVALGFTRRVHGARVRRPRSPHEVLIAAGALVLGRTVPVRLDR